MTLKLTATTDDKNHLWVLTPFFGTLIFIILYIIATLFYPGGSQVDKNATGFSWKQNYWCNLLMDNAINGQHNPARPIALTGMFVLCLTLAIFWLIFPQQTGLQKTSNRITQMSGVISMTTAMFLFTNFHDIVINIAGFFGIIATIGTFIGLYKMKWRQLFWLGVFNLILVALNNFLYYGSGLLTYLPVVQKITFLFFLLWICMIDINLYRRQSKII